MALTTTPLGRKVAFDMTEQTVLSNVPDVNVRAGPTTLYGLDLDNTTTSSSANWIKLFDDTGDGLAAAVVGNTARPDIIIPVVAVGAVGATPILGRLQAMWPEGLPFTNGLCWLASKAAGNDFAAAPDDDFRVQAVTAEAA